jgi:UDP-N-acetylmuramate--alanine ligase
MGEMILRVPGVHNVYNALAAIAVGFELEVSFEKIVEGLHQFTARVAGSRRKVKVDGVLVVDDYGHHPTRSAPHSRPRNSAQAAGAS